MSMSSRAAGARERRKRSIRKRVRGTPERPRIVVFRSAKHIYAQVVDDTQRRVLCGASTLSPALRDTLSGQKKRDQAKRVGELVGRMCLERKIDKVVFDRGGFQYHGRIKALADGARAAGLKF
jgi:large subunit ribosomal protein L18